MQHKERRISLDLYRILCMFLITTVHIDGYSKLLRVIDLGHYNFYLLNVLSVFQRFSITGFVLISAYFLVDSADTRKKIISFWLQLIFFSLTIFLLVCGLDPAAFSMKYLFKSLFPVFSYHYWYPVSYLILLIFAPIINKFIKALSRKELLTTILLLGFFVSVFFHLNPCFDETVFIGHYSHSLILFLFLYLIAGYIRLHGVQRPTLLGPVLFLICGVALFLLFTVKNIANRGDDAQAGVVSFFQQVNLLSYNSLLPVLLAVSSFITFLNLKATPPRWLHSVVRFLVPATFGVYLIQEHNVLRTAIWTRINIRQYAHSPWLLPMMLLIFLCLFAASLGIQLLYRLAHKLFLGKLEKALFHWTDRIASRFHR